MKNVDFNQYIIETNLNVREAMKKLDESNRKTLVVVKGEIIYGTLTDGDIRRWIINGESFEDSVINVCNQSPITFSENYDIEKIKNCMLKKRIQAIPIKNSENQIVDLLFWDEVFGPDNYFEIKDKIDIPVIIMAGGSGTRLTPFTKILPKPLIPIGEKTVIEVVINKFREFGINEYYISLFHKSLMIKAYFDELKPPYSIHYLEEEKPLGTAGILTHVHDLIESDSIFLTNCDTIINCNYLDLLNFHDDNKYDVTLVGSMINFKVPYGICEIESGGKLISLKEKPEYSYLASTGMYLIRRKKLSLIPKNKFYNMTDLIGEVKRSGGKVGVYPISEKSWLDTGEWKEYKKTVEQLTL